MSKITGITLKTLTGYFKDSQQKINRTSAGVHTKMVIIMVSFIVIGLSVTAHTHRVCFYDEL